MGEISDPRKVIDRRRLTVELAALADEGKLDEAAVSRVLKSALAEGRAEVRRRFDATGDGRMAARTLSYLMDQIIRALHDAATQLVFPLANPSTGERLAVVAVGGYGRGELAPHSDIDLLFLQPYKRTPYVEQVIEYMLYRLWDLGLKVGHSVRSVEECIRQAKNDLTIRTALLEARYIWGEQSLYQDLRAKFLKQIVAGTGPAFVEAKLAERNQRHRRMGDSRYSLEANIKDGKGGLRDLHTLFWIAKYLYRVDDVTALVDRGVFTAEEARRFEKTEAFLWSLRFHLHYLTDRPEERLTFDLQPELARRMGYTDHAGSRGVERLMKHYFLIAKTVGDLTRIFCAVLETQHQKRSLLARARFGLFQREIEGFPVDGDRLAVADAEVFKKDPVNLLRLFEVAQRHDLDIHPASLRLVTRNLKLVDAKLRADPEANRLFVAMLTSKKGPEITLRRLNEAGVFGRFMPDFGRVVAQMQYDMYHHFTVDEHTIFAIGILWKIEQGLIKDEVPIASEVVHLVQSRRVLYLAVLLHDIAKGRGGDHSELGADIALKLGPRLGFTDEETETVSWLVRYHLIMSNTAFKRDIDDPKTIQDFVAAVQSLERLRLLLVLTVADIRAVGPKVWNGWKAQLLRDLYWRAEEMISGGLIAEKREERVKVAVDALRGELGDWTVATFADHVARGTPSYWLAYDKETLARHARLVERAERDGEVLALDTRIDHWRAVTEVTVYTADRPGLFARLAGALALAGANIAAADIFTLSNGKALDNFQVQDGEGREIERPEDLKRIRECLERMLADDEPAPPDLVFPPSPLGRRTELFKVAPRVLIDNKGSAEHSLIEVNGRDRRGLLYGLTKAIAAQKLQIMSAKVSTFGARAVDVFYVKDKFGLKVEGDARLKPIRDALMAVLEEGEGRAASPPAAPSPEDPNSDSAAAE
ncbi:[protein-PII] uridylyltransferase [Hypericibacter sp.]|uniref:[protein-PII] uridylyltransferase n=1 Tax=Hypericibacter sp. TaxID=2705401 RepID=UPI003D6D74FF